MSLPVLRQRRILFRKESETKEKEKNLMQRKKRLDIELSEERKFDTEKYRKENFTIEQFHGLPPTPQFGIGIL
jgi:hypothetical protein